MKPHENNMQKKAYLPAMHLNNIVYLGRQKDTQMFMLTLTLNKDPRFLASLSSVSLQTSGNKNDDYRFMYVFHQLELPDNIQAR